MGHCPICLQEKQLVVNVCDKGRFVKTGQVNCVQKNKGWFTLNDTTQARHDEDATETFCCRWINGPVHIQRQSHYSVTLSCLCRWKWTGPFKVKVTIFSCCVVVGSCLCTAAKCESPLKGVVFGKAEGGVTAQYGTKGMTEVSWLRRLDNRMASIRKEMKTNAHSLRK
jgi:hypothetical protein